ncbi:MAG: GGDEF domain-containing protein [Mycolicibacterium cosmeticum]|nr:GGDEF domain-containing protein [Mycolicibacterium cosmeticum]
MHRLNWLAGAHAARSGQKQRARLLRIYLAATTFLYVYGVVFTLFPVRTDITYGDPTGGIIAVILGIGALAYLAISPVRGVMVATVAAVAATPIVMAFHVSMTAEYVCLIAPMFLAMYLRAFHPPRQAWTLIAALTTACVVAVAVAPAPHVGVITFLIIAVAISAAAESFGLLIRAMFAAACTDPLTGLLNRAGWEIATADLLRRCRTPVPVAVIALDIDGLKVLNDTYGHTAGDRRITEYAHLWQKALSRGTALARLGGDEFAICIVGAGPETVREILRTIDDTTPAVSHGVATQDSTGTDIAALYAQADAALYKSRGRPLQDDSDIER